MSSKVRKAMIGRANKLSIKRQCELVKLSRSCVYYQANELLDKDLQLMQGIDKIHLKRPFYGSRRIRDWLEDQGYVVNRKKVRRLMRKMGVMALYPKPSSSHPGKGHRIYPYLLRGKEISSPNQVWATDITYIPMAKGFMYLVVIMDWRSRKVLSWRVSNSLESDFCVDALEEALRRYGKPEIFNTDQGAQFTSEAFTGVLKAAEISISMDGKGRWIDNVFVERLWRSLKYEEVYLRAYESISEAKAGIRNYFQFYNQERRHQGLGKITPDGVYFNNLGLPKVA